MTSPIEKLTQVVAAMRAAEISTCPYLVATRLVIDECEPSPALDAVREQVDKMLAQVRGVCVSYDNLRSLIGTLERERGVEKPWFYVAPLNETSEPRKCKQCGMMKRPGRPVRAIGWSSELGLRASYKK